MNDQILESAVKKAITWVLREEGGIADVGDGEGLTRFGQTPAWLSQWKLPSPKSADEAAMNYQWWIEHVNLDALCAQDDALPVIVIDFAVNSGERVAIAALQRALGVTPSDGLLGPITAKALRSCDRGRVAGQVLRQRIALDGELVTNSPAKFAKFAHGWSVRTGRQIPLLVESCH